MKATHGQHDHVGRLPALFDAGFDGEVGGTRATLELGELKLRDGIELAGGGAGAEVVLREAGYILGSASAEIGMAGSCVVVSGAHRQPTTGKEAPLKRKVRRLLEGVLTDYRPFPKGTSFR